MIAAQLTCRFPAVAPRLLLTAGLAVLILPSASAAQAREQTLYVSALTKAGQPVDTLATTDVLVQEDGVTREVLRVARATDPMQVAILVDNSSISAAHISNMRDGLRRLLAAFPSGHAFSLVTYADRPTLLASLTTDQGEIEKGIDRIFAQTSSGAYVIDAVDETARGFIKNESARPVIVVLAFEGSEFSNGGYQGVLERLRESGAQLHVVQLVEGRGDRTQEERDRSIVIDRGTRETGGRRDSLLTSMSFPAAFDALAAELNAQFKVVYARPESLIPPRETKVSSANPALEIRGVLVKDRRAPRR